jgi:ABC-type transport system substrate-binding protein
MSRPDAILRLWALASTLTIAGCRGGAPDLDFPANAQVLRLAELDDVPTLDPAAGYDTASWTFEQMIFDTLVRYSDAGVDLVPDLATSWEIAPDAGVESRDTLQGYRILSRDRRRGRFCRETRTSRRGHRNSR